MSGGLTTHVLDTARGIPARGLKIELFRVDHDRRNLLNTAVTNDDGRTDEPVLNVDRFATGTYELVFHAGEYHRSGETGEPDMPVFLDVIPVRFVISQTTHYHVPLLLSPYSYSTYRGS